MNKKHFFSTLLITVFSLLFVSCQQEKPYRIVFLTESESVGMSSKLIVNFKGRTYTRLPMLTSNNFSHFKSYIQDDGSYGVTLFLDKKYSSRLYTATAAKIGKRLLTVVSGLAFEPQIITAPITNGQLYIRSGLNGYDLRRISETIKPIDDMEEKRYLEIDPRPRPVYKEIKNQAQDFSGRTIPELPQRN